MHAARCIGTAPDGRLMRGGYASATAATHGTTALLAVLCCVALCAAAAATAAEDSHSNAAAGVHLPMPVHIAAPPPAEPPPPVRSRPRRPLRSWQAALTSQKRAWRAKLLAPEPAEPPPARNAEHSQQQWRAVLRERRSSWRVALRTASGQTAATLLAAAAAAQQPRSDGNSGLTARLAAASATPVAAQQPTAAAVARLAAAAGASACPTGSQPIAVAKLRFVGAAAADPGDATVTAAIASCAADMLAINDIQAATSVGTAAPAATFNLTGPGCTGVAPGVSAARRLLQNAMLTDDSSPGPCSDSCVPPPPPPPQPPEQEQPDGQLSFAPGPQTAPTNFSAFTALDANVTYCVNSSSQPFNLEVPEYSAHAVMNDCLSAAGVTLKILTNEYIVLPAAGDYLLHAESPGYTETHGFTATIGLQGGLAVAPSLQQQTAMLSVLTDQLTSSATGLASVRWLNLTYCPATKQNEFNVGVTSVGATTALSERLAQAPARIADIWDTLQLGLNLTGLTVVDAPQLTVAGQLAALGVRLDDSTANSTTGGSSLSGGAIAGIAAAALVFLVMLVVIAVLCVLLKRRWGSRRTSRRTSPRESGSGAEAGGKSASRQGSELDPAVLQMAEAWVGYTPVDNPLLRAGSASSRARLKGTGEEAAQSMAAQATMGRTDLFVSGWDISPEDVQICRHSEDGSSICLGSGQFGKVYKAVRAGVQDVAVKFLHRANAEDLQKFIEEVSILKSLNYDKNIVQFYGACMRPGQDLMLVTEYMAGGDLRAALDKDGRRDLVWDRKGQKVALDIARGIHFLHSHDVIHCDIKTSNVLLSEDWSTAKVADVGVAQLLGNYNPDNVGWTFSYAAPELLLGHSCTSKVDVYSFGVVLWEICTGRVPTRGRLEDPDVPGDCPADILMLIRECMQVVPDARPNMKHCFDRIKAAYFRRRTPDFLRSASYGDTRALAASSWSSLPPRLRSVSFSGTTAGGATSSSEEAFPAGAAAPQRRTSSLPSAAVPPAPTRRPLPPLPPVHRFATGSLPSSALRPPPSGQAAAERPPPAPLATRLPAAAVAAATPAVAAAAASPTQQMAATPRTPKSPSVRGALVAERRRAFEPEPPVASTPAAAAVARRGGRGAPAATAGGAPPLPRRYSAPAAAATAAALAVAAKQQSLPAGGPAAFDTSSSSGGKPVRPPPPAAAAEPVASDTSSVDEAAPTLVTGPGLASAAGSPPSSLPPSPRPPRPGRPVRGPLAGQASPALPLPPGTGAAGAADAPVQVPAAAGAAPTAAADSAAAPARSAADVTGAAAAVAAASGAGGGSSGIEPATLQRTAQARIPVSEGNPAQAQQPAGAAGTAATAPVAAPVPPPPSQRRWRSSTAGDMAAVQAASARFRASSLGAAGAARLGSAPPLGTAGSGQWPPQRRRPANPQQAGAAMDWSVLVSNPLIADLWGGDLSASAGGFGRSRVGGQLPQGRSLGASPTRSLGSMMSSSAGPAAGGSQRSVSLPIEAGPSGSAARRTAAGAAAANAPRVIGRPGLGSGFGRRNTGFGSLATAYSLTPSPSEEERRLESQADIVQGVEAAIARARAAAVGSANPAALRAAVTLDIATAAAAGGGGAATASAPASAVPSTAASSAVGSPEGSRSGRHAASPPVSPQMARSWSDSFARAPPRISSSSGASEIQPAPLSPAASGDMGPVEPAGGGDGAAAADGAAASGSPVAAAEAAAPLQGGGLARLLRSGGRRFRSSSAQAEAPSAQAAQASLSAEPQAPAELAAPAAGRAAEAPTEQPLGMARLLRSGGRRFRSSDAQPAPPTAQPEAPQASISAEPRAAAERAAEAAAEQPAGLARLLRSGGRRFRSSSALPASQPVAVASQQTGTPRQPETSQQPDPAQQSQETPQQPQASGLNLESPQQPEPTRAPPAGGTSQPPAASARLQRFGGRRFRSGSAQPAAAPPEPQPQPQPQPQQAAAAQPAAGQPARLLRSGGRRFQGTDVPPAAEAAAAAAKSASGADNAPPAAAAGGTAAAVAAAAAAPAAAAGLLSRRLFRSDSSPHPN